MRASLIDSTGRVVSVIEEYDYDAPLWFTDITPAVMAGMRLGDYVVTGEGVVAYSPTEVKLAALAVGGSPKDKVQVIINRTET